MTYEYACGACGHEWEAEQSISAAPLKKCPKCGKSKAKRLVSGGTGFLLKGGGWYADGYGSSTGSSSGSSSSDGDGGSTSSSEGKAKKPKSTSSKKDDKSAA